ncbi:MAG: response regulator [Candidatus Gracilibacteria bacterium]|jgi:CheY-like chemotaxis protein
METPSLGRNLLWLDNDPEFRYLIQVFFKEARKDITLVLAESEQEVLDRVQTEDIQAVVTNLMMSEMKGAVLVKILEDLIIAGRWNGKIAMVTRDSKAALDYLGRNNVRRAEEIPIFSKPFRDNGLHRLLAQIGFGISSPVALQSLATSPRGVGNA